MTEPTPGRPGDPVPVALALLDRHWPPGPPLTDVAGSAVAGAAAGLEADPRYVIGRLQQALTALLAAELPPMDPLTSLLSAALADAIAWRQHDARPCPRCTDSLCEPCNADWDQADRYHALARALGAVGTIPASTAPPAPPPSAAA
jgi:hypothetical protein